MMNLFTYLKIKKSYQINNNIIKTSFEPTSNSKSNLIETDFIEENKKATYKPNEKTKELTDKEVNFY